MSHYTPDKQTFTKLKDTVVVISGELVRFPSQARLLTERVGGSTGIGAATVKTLAQAGAIVFLGDVNTEAAEQLCKEHSNVSFVKCDVTKYDDIYTLFRTAYDKHGKIDHAISCAGIFGMPRYNVFRLFSRRIYIDCCNRNGKLV